MAVRCLSCFNRVKPMTTKRKKMDQIKILIVVVPFSIDLSLDYIQDKKGTSSLNA